MSRVLHVSCFLTSLLLLLLPPQGCLAYPKRYTFELPDGESHCFYESLRAPGPYVFLYQVIYGKNLDVDVTIKDANGQIVKHNERSSQDEITIKVEKNGTYSFCFGNEFSSTTHKMVFFELSSDVLDTLAYDAGETQPHGVLSRALTNAESVHLYLSRAESLQIKLRNRDAADRLVGEDLNAAVMHWSATVVLMIVFTTIGQVYLLRRLFADKPTIQASYGSRF